MSDDDEEEDEVYEFNGIQYDSYQEMVNAKRQRNQQVLEASGLLEASAAPTRSKPAATQRGLKRRKSAASDGVRRKSNRLQGIASDGLFVEEERSGKFTVQHKDDGSSAVIGSLGETTITTAPEFYGGRLNDGSDMTLQDGLARYIGDKWLTENAVERARPMLQQLYNRTGDDDNDDKTLTNPTSRPQRRRRQTQNPLATTKASPKSVIPQSTIGDDDDTIGSNSPPSALLQALSLDDAESSVAKVTPDRIYSMACHPSLQKLLVCAGDKQGYVGLWDVEEEGEQQSEEQVNQDDSSSRRHYLFRYHSSVVTSLEWTGDGRALFSTSYDGTCRLLDLETEQIQNVFCAHDDATAYRALPGHGLDQGRAYWTQFGCLDHRQEECFFVSTSLGNVYHIDSRVSGKAALSWNVELSEKKINTVSLHPNGHALATAGLDCQVRLWDIRKLGGKQKHKEPKPIGYYHGSKSINSAFFSPSGRHLVATTMNHKLDILEDFHLSTSSSNKPCKPSTSIRHDNLTGRWLTTFQAVWHPHFEVFGVGSMKRPRIVEIFDSTQRLRDIGGEALTAVASRFAFHPRTDRLILAGGNSSGRVTVAR